MNQDEIIEMARQAGMVVVNDKFSLFHFLELFAKLVADKEREACAKLCYELGARDDSFYSEFSRSEDCAEAIRARGEA
jgi:uncharacterized protein with PIN domain